MVRSDQLPQQCCAGTTDRKAGQEPGSQRVARLGLPDLPGLTDADEPILPLCVNGMFERCVLTLDEHSNRDGPASSEAEAVGNRAGCEQNTACCQLNCTAARLLPVASNVYKEELALAIIIAHVCSAMRVHDAWQRSWASDAVHGPPGLLSCRTWVCCCLRQLSICLRALYASAKLTWYQ